MTVHREITVPDTGSEDFARTLDCFFNPTSAPITTTVRIVGNLGSDGATTVWGTSDGDNLVEVTDQWVGTDNGSGSPAILHYIHGPLGLQPTSICLIGDRGDNIEWTYQITVQPGRTVRLATFTIVAATRAGAQAAAQTLVTTDAFGGQADAFLSRKERNSIANFRFDVTPPTVASLSPADEATAVPVGAHLVLTFSEPVVKGETGNLVVRFSSDDSLVTVFPVSLDAVTVSGQTVTIDLPGDLAQHRRYTVQVDPGAFEDMAGNLFAGITNRTSWNFMTAGTLTIDVGDVYLLPNTANQIVPLYVHGGVAVQGVQFNVQVADGYPNVPHSTIDGPDITGADLTGAGTVFGSAPLGNSGNSFAIRYPQIWIGGTTVNEDSTPNTTVTVPAEGLLVNLVISTVGWDLGNGPWDLLLKNTFNGTTQFQTPDGPMLATISNGRIFLNAAPVAHDDTLTTNEDTPLAIAPAGVLANDSDADGDPLHVTGVVTTGLRGTLVSWAADGSFEYQPPPNYATLAPGGEDGFDYTIADAHGHTATAHVSITVASVNDAPSGANKAVTMLEDGVYVLAAADFGFTDPSDNPANAPAAVNITTLPGAGTLRLSGAAVVAGQFVLAADIAAGQLTFAPGPDDNGAGYASFTFQVQDDGGTARGGVDLDPTPNTLSFDVTPVADVNGRYLFYNNSAFDGYDAAATDADYDAIAPAPSVNGHGHAGGADEPDKQLGKQALLPGQTATFVHYTSYGKGINGILLTFDDLADPAALTAADFVFRVGNSDVPAMWSLAPAPLAIRVQQNATHPNFAGHPDVVTILWADENPYTRVPEPGAISNQWLQITVLAGAHTGLAQNDVLYWGHQIGESGNSASDTNVDQNDEIGARNHSHTAFNPASLADPYDFNRDGKVDQNDEILARNNSATAFTRIQLIAAPSLLQAAGQPEGPASVGPRLTADCLAPAVAEAIARWQAVGLDEEHLRSLRAAQFIVASLAGSELAQASARAHVIAIDDDAAGRGWFLDPTPGTDEEFAAAPEGRSLVAVSGSPASDRVDLLSAVMHEMGHVLGRPDGLSQADELMASQLPSGLRRTPSPLALVDAALDAWQ